MLQYARNVFDGAADPCRAEDPRQPPRARYSPIHDHGRRHPPRRRPGRQYLLSERSDIVGRRARCRGCGRSARARCGGIFAIPPTIWMISARSVSARTTPACCARGQQRLAGGEQRRRGTSGTAARHGRRSRAAPRRAPAWWPCSRRSGAARRRARPRAPGRPGPGGAAHRLDLIDVDRLQQRLAVGEVAVERADADPARRAISSSDVWRRRPRRTLPARRRGPCRSCAARPRAWARAREWLVGRCR